MLLHFEYIVNFQEHTLSREIYLNKNKASIIVWWVLVHIRSDTSMQAGVRLPFSSTTF